MPGPVPIGVFNLHGAAFCDIGAVWNEDKALRLTRVEDGKRRFDDPRFGPGVGLGFGVGMRTSIWFAIAKLDVAWRTNLARVSDPKYHFSIGPEF